jgi:hypothetical protein
LKAKVEAGARQLITSRLKSLSLIFLGSRQGEATTSLQKLARPPTPLFRARARQKVRSRINISPSLLLLFAGAGLIKTRKHTASFFWCLI